MYRKLESVVDFKCTADVKVKGEPGLKDSSSLPNPRNCKTSNRKLEQSDLELPRAGRSSEQVQCCTNASRHKLYETTTDDVRNLLAVITAFEDVRNEVDLGKINVEGTL